MVSYTRSSLCNREEESHCTITAWSVVLGTWVVLPRYGVRKVCWVLPSFALACSPVCSLGARAAAWEGALMLGSLGAMGTGVHGDKCGLSLDLVWMPLSALNLRRSAGPGLTPV